MLSLKIMIIYYTCIFVKLVFFIRSLPSSHYAPMVNRKSSTLGLTLFLLTSAFAPRIVSFHFTLLFADPRPTHYYPQSAVAYLFSLMLLFYFGHSYGVRLCLAIFRALLPVFSSPPELHS